MPPSLGFLYLRVLKLAGLAVLVFLVASLVPSIWADPPAALRLGGAPPAFAGAVALFRTAEAVEASEVEFGKREDAARAALLERFPPGSDPSALVAFLTGAGHGRCEPTVMAGGHRGQYCLVQYGSLAALVLGLDRWRLREWVVGVKLAPDTGMIDDIGVRIPFLGKG